MQAAELSQLWVLHRQSRDRALRDRLIVQYAPLVKYVVGRMAVSLPGLLNTDDIISYGTIGLIQAVDRFDPSVGVKFETYAIQRIRGSILDAIRSLRQMSRDATRRARELEHAYDALIQALGRMPDNQEVAAHLGVTLDEFQSLLAEASLMLVSLDTPLGEAVDGERPSLIDQLADEGARDVPAEVERQQLYRALVRAIQDLPERDRLVINLYYYEDLTLKEISQVLGVSTSRVSQLHAAAVFKLRGALRVAMAAPVAA